MSFENPYLEEEESAVSGAGAGWKVLLVLGGCAAAALLTVWFT